MSLTLKQLRYADALAAQGHFGRAADLCAVSQPALSQQIKELETSLGQPLFERASSGVRPTPFGTRVLVRARAVLREVEALTELARAEQAGGLQKLRLGVIPTIAPYFLPRVIAGLGSTQPDLDVHVRETITPRLVEELTAGDLDVAIIALPLADPNLTETHLFTEELVLIRPGTEAGTPPPPRTALAQRRLLLLEDGHCFRDQALAFCNIAPGRPREGLDGTSLSTLVQMVGAGIGITLIPDMAVAVETRSAPVCMDRFGDNAPRRKVGMVWRKGTPLTQQFEALTAEIKAAHAGTPQSR